MNAKERLEREGFDDVVILNDFPYDNALIGVTEDNRAVYDYDKMVMWLLDNEGFKTIEEAMEYIDYSIVGTHQLAGAPIIYYPLSDEEGD